MALGLICQRIPLLYLHTHIGGCEAHISLLCRGLHLAPWSLMSLHSGRSNDPTAHINPRNHMMEIPYMLGIHIESTTLAACKEGQSTN